MRPATLLMSMALAAGLLACHPPTWRAEGGARAGRVQRLVLVGRAEGCQCTREDVAKAMRSLGTVLGARRDRMVTQLDWDKDQDQVQRNRRQRRFVALPALSQSRSIPSVRIEETGFEGEVHEIGAARKL